MSNTHKPGYSINELSKWSGSAP